MTTFDIPTLTSLGEIDDSLVKTICKLTQRAACKAFGPCLGKETLVELFDDVVSISYGYYDRELEDSRDDWLSDDLGNLACYADRFLGKFRQRLRSASLRYSKEHPEQLLRFSEASINSDVIKNNDRERTMMTIVLCLQVEVHIYKTHSGVPVIQQHLWDAIRLGDLREVRWLLSRGARSDTGVMKLAQYFRKCKSPVRGDEKHKFLRKQERKDRKNIHKLILRKGAQSNLLTAAVFQSMSLEEPGTDVATLTNTLMNQ